MSEVQIRSCLHPDYHLPEWQDVLARIHELNDSESAVSLHAGRNNIKKLRVLDTEIAIKYFRNRGLGKKLAYKFRSSKAKRSFEHTQTLLDAGLLSPQPIAWREDWQGKWLSQSYYICVYHKVAYTAWDIKDNCLPNNAHWIAQMGKQIGLMHQAGIHHQDLTPGNVLFIQREDADQFDLYFIDCNRMSFGSVAKEIGLRALVRMGLEGEHIDIYATAYAEARNLDTAWCCERYRQLLERHKLIWRIKNKTRPWRRKIGL